MYNTLYMRAHAREYTLTHTLHVRAPLLHTNDVCTVAQEYNGFIGCKESHKYQSLCHARARIHTEAHTNPMHNN